MQRTPHIFPPLLLSASLLLFNSFAAASDSVAYYSDSQNDRVVAFDPVEMSIRTVMPTKGENALSHRQGE